MSTVVGRAAEGAAAEYLQSLGYAIVTQNWRTRWCEIDIIAQKEGVVYFVEVKYRRSNAWGSGLEYITPAKLRQMHIAARFWIANNRAQDYRLSVAELTGQPPRVAEWLDSID